MIYKAKVRETEHLEVYKQVDEKIKANTHERWSGEWGRNVNLV